MPRPSANPSPQPKRGAWVPWPVVEATCRLGLARPSLWRVYLAVLLTCCRYGGQEARLTTQEIMAMTGLPRRTVQRAMAELQASGTLCRAGRYGRLTAPGGANTVALPDGTVKPSDDPGGAATVAPPDARAGKKRGATVAAPPRRHSGGASPTVFRFALSSLDELRKGAGEHFSPKQRQVILDAMAESSELAGQDAWDLGLPPEVAQLLRCDDSVTFRLALFALTGQRDKAQARDFVQAVLRLRQRLRGEEVLTAGEGRS